MEIIDLLTNEPLAVLSVKNKIKNFITTDLYQDLDDFIKDNPTFEDFKRRAKFNDSYRRALNWNTLSLTEDEYQQILSELKAELEEKMRIQNDKINTVKANGKEVSTYQRDDGSVITVNNSNNKPIDEQLKDMQEKYSRFRQDANTNTEELMEHMEEEITPETSFHNVTELNQNSLNEEESKIAEVAQAYQASSEGPVTVDLENRLIMDEGNILEIQQTDQGYAVTSPEQTQDNSEVKSTETPTKAKQKTLIMNPFKQAGFSDAIILALLTGMFIGLLLLNIYIKTM